MEGLDLTAGLRLSTESLIALVGRYGRLANRLWTYANVLAFALDRRIWLVNTAFLDYGNLFAATASADSGAQQRRGRWAEYHADRIAAQGWAISNAIDLSYRINLRIKYFPTIELGESSRIMLENGTEFENYIRARRLVFLSGFYLCAPECMTRHSPRIRRFFSPRHDIKACVEHSVVSARETCDVLIGVHMRQGDYRTFCDGLMFYSVEEYCSVMEILAEQLVGKRVKFLICSDESQDPQNFRGLDVLISRASAVEDLYILAYCDYIVGPNSSFSQWASWWGQVPLHVLDWRTAVTYKKKEPIFHPRIEVDFAPFEPHQFYQHSRKELFIDQFI